MTSPKTPGKSKKIRPTGGVPKGYRSAKVAERQSNRRFMVAVLLRRLHSADEIAAEMAKSETWSQISRATIIRDLRFLRDEGVAVQIKIGRFWKWYHVNNAPQKRDFPDYAFKRAPNGQAKNKRKCRRKRLLDQLGKQQKRFLDAVTETA